jgi:MFS family permease
MNRSIALIFSGSLIFQIVQIGSYPILISQLLAQDGVTTVVIGWLLAISWIAVFALGPFVPRIVHSLGYRLVNWVATGFSLAALALLLATSQVFAIFVSAVLMGVGLILRWINLDTLVVHASSEAERGRVIGFHEALMGFGIALGPLLFLIPDLRLVTLVSIALLAIAQLSFTLASMPTDGGIEEEATEGKRGKWNGFAPKTIAVALAAAFVAGYVENSSVALFPLHFEAFGYPLSASAILVSAFGFGGTLLQPPLGHLADRRGYVFAQSVCVAGIVASCIAIVALEQHQYALLPALFILGAAGGGLNTLAVIEAGKTLGMHHMPAAMTAIAMAYTVGSIGGPIVSGAVMPMFAHNGMVILFGGIALALGAYILGRRPSVPEPAAVRSRPANADSARHGK